MSWWRREADNIVAWMAAVLAGSVIWFASQWASDATWADVVGGVGAIAVSFKLLNGVVRASRQGF